MVDIDLVHLDGMAGLAWRGAAFLRHPVARLARHRVFAVWRARAWAFFFRFLFYWWFVVWGGSAWLYKKKSDRYLKEATKELEKYVQGSQSKKQTVSNLAAVDAYYIGK